LSNIQLPSLVISCSCFAHSLFQKIARQRPPNNNLVWIYDAGLLFDSSYSWGYVVKNEYNKDTMFYAGTVLTYWLLDALYAARDASSSYYGVLALHGKAKPNDQAAFPATIRVEGTSALLRQPFFGPNPVNGSVSQPAWSPAVSAFDLQNYDVQNGDNARPYMKDSLVKLIESMSPPPEFFIKCYDCQSLVTDPDKEIVVEQLCHKLYEKNLVDMRRNGALVCDVVVQINLVSQFEQLIDSYQPPAENTL